MTNLLKEQFGEALINFKMKNIDAASLHEIIGEFAPLIGVGIEDAVEMKKHQIKSSSNINVSPEVVNVDPKLQINSKNGVKNVKLKIENDPNTALDLTMKPHLLKKSIVSEIVPEIASTIKEEPATYEYAKPDIELPDYAKPDIEVPDFGYSASSEPINSVNINNNNESQHVESVVQSSSPAHLVEDSDTDQLMSSIADDGILSKTSKALYEIKTVYDLKYYQCRLCPKVYDTKYHLNRHLIGHGGNKPHRCDSCGKSFSQKCDLNRHMNVHNNLRKHTCSVCGKSFKRADYLSKHERQYCGVLKPHKCSKCSKGFEDMEQLNEHKRSHNETSFHCEHCAEEFSSVEKLVEHRKVHSKQDEKFTCTKCENEFTEFSSYVDHFKRHSGERPYACDLCQKVFSRNHNLMTHMWIHNQEKQHTCHICAKTFTYYSNLQVHLRVHRNERPYKCEECKKGFLTSSDLRRHKRTHSGEKPYKCDHCPAEYARKERLISHMISHLEQEQRDTEISWNNTVTVVNEQEMSGHSTLSNDLSDDLSKTITMQEEEEEGSRDSCNMEEETPEEEDEINDDDGEMED